MVFSGVMDTYIMMMLVLSLLLLVAYLGKIPMLGVIVGFMFVFIGFHILLNPAFTTALINTMLSATTIVLGFYVVYEGAISYAFKG